MRKISTAVRKDKRGALESVMGLLGLARRGCYLSGLAVETNELLPNPSTSDIQDLAWILSTTAWGIGGESYIPTLIWVVDI